MRCVEGQRYTAGTLSVPETPGATWTDRGTLLRVVRAWGTVITLEVALRTRKAGDAVDAVVVSETDAALNACEAEIARIESLFSTYRSDSMVCALRVTPSLEDQLPWSGDGGDVRAVLKACRTARSLSRGLFDPWKARGGLDPSGYVKGWGAGRLADTLVSGVPDAVGACVNAGGDVSVRGNQSDGTPWTIGLRNPADASQILRVVGAQAGHVATSGRYERGDHVVDPRADGTSGREVVQASVWGPDDGMADALATALLLGGRASAEWFQEVLVADAVGSRPSRWGCYVVEGSGAWRIGGLHALVLRV